MVVPRSSSALAPAAGEPWVSLAPAAKRTRLLDAAEVVLAREGLDAPMPAIAAAAGIGIGSVYRQFASKDDLIAALVVERLAWTTERVCASCDGRSAWDALAAVLRELIERQTGDDIMGAAFARTSERPDVAERFGETSRAFDALLARAREEGELRADATLDDVFLLFAATRAAAQRQPDGGARRMLDLLLDALRA